LKWRKTRYKVSQKFLCPGLKYRPNGITLTLADARRNREVDARAERTLRLLQHSRIMEQIKLELAEISGKLQSLQNVSQAYKAPAAALHEQVVTVAASGGLRARAAARRNSRADSRG
jgi:hypothetical protein